MKRKLLAVAALAAVVALGACGGGSVVTAGEGTAGTGDVGAGTTMGSCAQSYSPETLAERDFAFDGVVDVVTPGDAEGDPASVRFRVNEWYKGGSGAEVTLKSYAASGAVTSAGGAGIERGARLLVAGDDQWVWECGFTQPYQPQVASEWKAAIG